MAFLKEAPMRAIHGAAAWLVIGLWGAGCGGGDDGDDQTGRGTAACRDFQDAMCDFASDRCGAIDRATCDATFRGIECKSDEQASACANALNEASCGTGAPSACQLEMLVDRAPAIEACQTVTQAICDHNAMCGAPMVDCAASLAAMGGDCNQALSVDLRYELCLEAIDSLACGSPVPAMCMQVIFVLPPGL
jgi:hypothetical protein